MAATTKTVSLRVAVEDLETLRRAGVAPTEVMREALHRKAIALRAAAWVEETRRRAWKPPPGTPRSQDIIRAFRDAR